jgi:hypothetical protein
MPCLFRVLGEWLALPQRNVRLPVCACLPERLDVCTMAVLEGLSREWGFGALDHQRMIPKVHLMAKRHIANLTQDLVAVLHTVRVLSPEVSG